MHNDSDVLLALYAGVSSDDALREALTLIAQRFDCVGAALIYVDHRRPAAATSIAFGVLADPEVRRLYETTYGAHDPAPATMAKLEVGEVSSTDHLFDVAVYDQHSYFLENFYHRIGLGGALGGPVLRTETQVGLLAVQRSLSRRAFEQEEIAAFRRIMPHMAQVLDLRRKFYDIEARLAGLQEAVEPVNVGVMAFREDGTLDHANLAARAILSREDGLVMDRGGRLHALDPDAEAWLRRWFARRPLRIETGSFLARRQEEGEPSYTLRGRKLPGQEGGRPPLNSIVVADPARPVGDAASVLAAAYDLTPASLRLTGALIGGADLKSYAKSTGISIHTAKHHLSSAFAATGTRRQADLVRLALSLVRDVS